MLYYKYIKQNKGEMMTEEELKILNQLKKEFDTENINSYTWECLTARLVELLKEQEKESKE